MFEWLPDAIRGAEASPFAQREGWHFRLNPPATAEEIRQVEGELGRGFPPALRAFLLAWNGASLFSYASQVRGAMPTELAIPSASGVIELNRDAEDTWRDPIDLPALDRLIVFAETPTGSANYCALSAAHVTPTGEYAVVDCEEDFEPPCWERCVIAPGMEPWLRRTFDEAIASGEPYWWYNLPELREIKRGCMQARRARSWG